MRSLRQASILAGSFLVTTSNPLPGFEVVTRNEPVLPGSESRKPLL